MESKTVFTGSMPPGLRCADCSIQDECPESPINQFDRRGLDRPADIGDWQCAFATDTGNHDSASAIIRYASGLHLVYSQNFYTRQGAIARGATLIGSQGTISFDWYRNEIVVHSHSTGNIERIQPTAEGQGHHGGDEALAREFLAAIRGEGTGRASLSAGILSAQMCLYARESCRTNQFQDIVPFSQSATSRIDELLTREAS
jgi:predicted dehydrogenase